VGNYRTVATKKRKRPDHRYGIKRHLAVDTLGFPAWCIFMVGKPDRKCIRFFTHCIAANVSDDQGLIEMLTNNLDY
jgi:hypothetical protein